MFLFSKTLRKTLSKNRHYALALLTLTYVFNFVDRQLLSILIEPIKMEFNASDTEMGLLYGFAFALFYTTLAIPVARLADKHNRRNIVAIAATLWSALTMLCGLATNYWQLFLLRIGVAIGEAGGVPPSQSMITDHYPPHQRTKAMAVFASATFIGGLIAYVGGAYIAEHYGWRMAFIVVGAPGILLAVMLRYTTVEPQRGRFDQSKESAPQNATLRATLRSMWQIRSLRYMLVGIGFASMAGYAIGLWAPSFLIRVHDVSLQQAGSMLGIVGISFGLFGSFFGAAVCDHLAVNKRGWMLFMPALSLAISLPFMLLFLYWPQGEVTVIGESSIPNAIWAYCLTAFFGSWWAAPTYVAVQEVVPPHQRTLACAILLFVMNLAGFGLGPLLVGMMTDALTPEFGVLAIRYSLLIMMSAYIVAMTFYYLAGKQFVSHDQQQSLKSVSA